MEAVFELVLDSLFQTATRSKNRPLRLFASIVSGLISIGFVSFIFILSMYMLSQGNMFAGSLLMFLILLFGMGSLIHIYRYLNCREIKRSEVYN